MELPKLYDNADSQVQCLPKPNLSFLRTIYCDFDRNPSMFFPYLLVLDPIELSITYLFAYISIKTKES